MVGQHHQLKGHEFEQTLGDNEGQGNLACCSSWCCRVGHDLVTEQPQQNMEKTLFSKWCWEIQAVTCKRMKLEHFSHTVLNKLKMDQRPKFKI